MCLKFTQIVSFHFWFKSPNSHFPCRPTHTFTLYVAKCFVQYNSCRQKYNTAVCTKLTAVASLAVLESHKMDYQILSYAPELPAKVGARSEAWVCGHSPAEIAGSNPTGGINVCPL
jgi:hypothetical protein